ncbi:MAG: TonB-dependent receptor [Bacteroidota bacterium]
MLSRLRHLAWLLLLVSIPLSAQTARLAGSVTDAADGTALPGVTLTLPGSERGTVSDLDGRFEITGLAPGTYTLRASSIGYAPLTREVVLRADQTTEISLALAPQTTDLTAVTVVGRAANLVGVAGAASEGRVGQTELAPRPLLRVGEVLETIPGAVVTQHSGSGKANQYFLRGFNLDHGTDFAASVAGVPINLPTHAHGQGYLDLGFLIPELIDEIAFEKGPLNAAAGNFSTAGRAEIQLVRRLDEGIAMGRLGDDNSAEALVANSATVGGGDLLLGLRTRYTDGPWVNPENGTLASAVASFATGTEADGLTLTAMGYFTDWDATDQIPSRAVPEQVSRLGAIDPTNGGTTGRYTLAADWRTAQASGSQTRVQAYGAIYHLDLFSNFTYFLDDPTRGDQFEQRDRRVYGGASVEQTWRPSALRSALTLGADFRHDQILGVGLYRTDARERIGTIREDDVAETSLGAYLQAETRWTDWARSTLGLRADAFRFDVTSDLAVNSGTETALLASPKARLVFGPWADTEVYLGGGLGFHSNDARGTTIRVDPATGASVNPVDPLVRTRGAEIGVRTVAVPGLQSTVSLWTVGLDSELVFVGDAGGTEASDASLHTGVEIASFYRATDWLRLALDVALTRSRFTEGDPDARRIENSVGRVISGGVYAGGDAGPLASLQLRHFGPRPLTGDGSITSDAATLVNARVGYGIGRVALALDVLNVLNSEAADVSYFYESRLPGEATAVEDVHFHPVPPRTARASAIWRF